MCVFALSSYKHIDMKIIDANRNSKVYINFNLLVVFFFSFVTLLHVTPLYTSWTSTTEGRLVCEIDVLLAIKPDNERWYVYYLSANADMSLTDQNTSMMNRLCKSKFENLSLKTALQEIFNFQTQYVIELHATFI